MMTIASQKQSNDLKWPRAVVSRVIGTISLGVLVLVMPGMFFDYLVFPFFKEGYIWPEWRYRIFDAVLVAWCVDGIIAATLPWHRRVDRPEAKRWADRMMILYFAGFIVLAVGVMLGMWLRRHGA
jgi:hypothetical protein